MERIKDNLVLVLVIVLIVASVILIYSIRSNSQANVNRNVIELENEIIDVQHGIICEYRIEDKKVVVRYVNEANPEASPEKLAEAGFNFIEAKGLEPSPNQKIYFSPSQTSLAISVE